MTKSTFLSIFGTSGEVCGPHGAGPGEGVLAPERHPVPRYLHHGVPAKVTFFSPYYGDLNVNYFFGGGRKAIGNVP